MARTPGGGVCTAEDRLLLAAPPRTSRSRGSCGRRGPGASRGVDSRQPWPGASGLLCSISERKAGRSAPPLRRGPGREGQRACPGHSHHAAGGGRWGGERNSSSGFERLLQTRPRAEDAAEKRAWFSHEGGFALTAETDRGRGWGEHRTGYEALCKQGGLLGQPWEGRVEEGLLEEVSSEPTDGKRWTRGTPRHLPSTRCSEKPPPP